MEKLHTSIKPRKGANHLQVIWVSVNNTMITRLFVVPASGFKAELMFKHITTTLTNRCSKTSSTLVTAKFTLVALSSCYMNSNTSLTNLSVLL